MRASWSIAVYAFGLCMTGYAVAAVGGAQAVDVGRSPPVAGAPTDRHMRLAGELVDAAGGRAAFDTAMRQVSEGMNERFQKLTEQFPVGSADYLTTRRYVEKIKAMLASEFTWNRLRPQYVRLYANVFSDQDMQRLIAFYHTKTGVLLRRKQPELAAQTTQLMTREFQDLVPKIAALAQQMQHELRQNHGRH